jgi:hypothetical protein
MRLLRFLIFTLFVLPSYALGQDVQFQCVNTVAAALPDYALAVGYDANGNVYSMGTFQGTVDMDPGPGVFPMTALGLLDIFIVKLRRSRKVHLGSSNRKQLLAQRSTQKYGGRSGR